MMTDEIQRFYQAFIERYAEIQRALDDYYASQAPVTYNDFVSSRRQG